ncbi:hypothetical protein [Mycolicibacterium sp.]|uniref:hypothetical protein n=1 Tax=Mycolicibacterium sp. TaxID=2320850 RepID=UPI003D11B831
MAGLLVWKATSNPSGTGDPTPTASDGTDRTVGLLRERDPVCDDWERISNELSARQEKWNSLNKGIPASKWTPDHRAIFLETGEAMTQAADQFESILPKARSILLQELIAQSIVYLRGYVTKIPTYVDRDGLLSGAAGNFGNAVTYMCSAVPILPAPGASDVVWESTVSDPSTWERLMTAPDPICDEFLALTERQKTLLGGWAVTDASIPAEEWTPKQRALNDAVREVLKHNIPEFRRVAEKAKGRIVGDLLATQNAYMQAFADAIPTYVPDDNQLWSVSIALGGGVGAACKAAA